MSSVFRYFALGWFIGMIIYVIGTGNQEYEYSAGYLFGTGLPGGLVVALARGIFLFVKSMRQKEP